MTENRTTVVRVSHVSKSFKLPHERQNSLKGKLINFHKRGYETQTVLRDISFDVYEGEFFGIVGRNGSGKSTLLKLLSGIYQPSSGTIDVKGKITPFIELGVGFNPELSGKDNVYLNGALLGFDRAEVDRMYDDIVGFAELEKFMDQKLKNYSSGMQVRLAFSIAIRARGDVLILDEVLAVGDEAFQKKCIAVFQEYKLQRKTVILVTHDMSVVQKFCDRAILISDGSIIDSGSPRRIAVKYSNQNAEAYASSLKKTGKKRTPATSLSLTTYDTEGKETTIFREGDTMRVVLSWTGDGVRHAGIALTRPTGEVIFGPNTFSEQWTGIGSSDTSLSYELTTNVFPGEYYLQAATYGSSDGNVIERVLDGPVVTIVEDDEKARYVGLTRLKHEWKVGEDTDE